MTARKCPVFICYRQVDGTKIAQWLFKILHEQRLPDNGHVETEEKVSSLDVYFDQTAPAVGNWKEIHQPRLHTSQAMIVVCTPGVFQKLEKNDWVHREIDWWLKNRKVAPILIDATGEGERWVPKVIKDRWPDAQRITVVQDDLLRLQGQELRLFEEQVRSRILNGIVFSKQRVVFEDLERQKKMSRRLSIALVIAGILLLSTILAAVLAMQARDSARENARVAGENARRATENAKIAEENARRATENAKIALARQLAAEASVVRERYPERSVLLAAEALQASSALDRMVPAAEQSLRDALMACSGTPLILPAGEKGGLRVSRDGQWLLNPRGDKTAELWKLAGPSQPIRPIILSGYTDTIELIFVSRNDRWAATSHEGGRVRVWNIQADGPAQKIAVLEKGEERVRVNDIDLDGRGRWLASGSYSEHQLWDLQAGDSPKLIYEVYSNGGSHDPVAISPDGRWFAAIGYEKKASDNREARYRAFERGQKVILLDLRTSNPTENPVYLPVSRKNFTLRTVLFTPDGRWLIAAGGDSRGNVDYGAAHLWKHREFFSGAQPSFTLNTTNSIYSLAVSPDSRWLATGVSDEFARDQTARVWDLNASDPSAAPFLLTQHQGAVHTMAFCAGSRFFATGAEDKLVRIWNLEAEDPVASLRELRGLGEAIARVTFDAGNKYVTALDRNAKCRMWELAYLEQSNGTMLFAGQEEAVRRILVSGDNRWVFSSGADETIRRWELNSTVQPAMPTTLGRFPGGAGAIAVSPNGRWLASSAGLKARWSQGTHGQRIPNEKTINLWDFQTSEKLEPTVLRGHEGEVHSLAFSVDSQWLISGGSDGAVRIWQLAASGEVKIQHVLKSPHRNTVLITSPDQRWLATTSGASISLWSRPFTAPGTNSIVLQTLQSSRSGPPVLSISPDSHWMAAANAHKSIVRLWDLSADDPSLKAFDLDIAGETQNDPSAPWKYIDNLAFSHDNRWLAVVHNLESGKQGTIWLWDLSAGPDAGRRPVPLRGHEGYIMDLAFSPGSKWLATASMDVWGSDNTIRIWHMREMETSISPIVLRGHRGGVSTLAFSPDGRWLISGSEDRTLQRWPMTTEDLLDRARETAGRNLSANEWLQYFMGQEYQKTFEAFPRGT